MNLVVVKILVESHFLVKITQGKLFVMDCQEIEIKKKMKKEVKKTTHEYTTTLLIIFMSIK